VGRDYVLAMACIVGIHVIATLGLNLTTGNAGLISLSHGAFLGVGCYTVAWLGKLGVPFYVPCRRRGASPRCSASWSACRAARQGLYLAIATLAAHFILSFCFREWRARHRRRAGHSIPRANLFGFEFAATGATFYLIFVCAFVMAIAARNLARTHIGRAFVAVRDRDISAEILGVHLLRTSCSRFAVGAFYAGIAGGLLGYFYGNITPDYFVLTLSVFYLARDHRRRPRHGARQHPRRASS
jgi:branched-chain amino acid transport system permease protein